MSSFERVLPPYLDDVILRNLFNNFLDILEEPGILVDMNVLVLCEYSGRVRDAFLARGHNAVSCDFLPSESPNGPHYQGDAVAMLKSLSTPLDLIIAHPPCTALTVAGNGTYGEGKAGYQDRLDACKWTKDFWELCKSKAPRVCFENPKGVLQRMAGFPKPHYVHPWQFGHPEKKMTGLFLANLRPLVPTNDVKAHMETLPLKEQNRMHYTAPGPDRWKIRSTTFLGIAEAMADQWG